MSDELLFEDVLEDPSKFGAPSFAEFAKNKDFWTGKSDEVLTQVDNGSTIFKKGLKKFRFEINGYRCKTLSEIERVAREQGIDLKQLEYKPELVPLGGGEAEMLVRFVSKDERSRRREELNGHI